MARQHLPLSKALRSRGALFATAALAMILGGQPAFAQDAVDGEPEADEEATIIVTGSRISRPELEVANPIVAITAETIVNSGKTNIADVLQRNPALTGSINLSRAGGADANFNETGANLLDLRNLGTNRTLVLVNGKRHVAGISGSAAVDINTIPQDLIEKVDVLTGGASAIYGADGVSGVVNFVLKRNFEGILARGQIGISERGDAGSRLGSVTIGRNFAGDRGNIAVAYEFSDQDRLSSFGRKFSGDPFTNRQLLQDPDDFDVDDPARPDRIIFTNVRWADSAPDGAVDLDGDFVPDFTGSGLPYDQGLLLPASGGRTIGGSSTPTAGYFGDLVPSNRVHSFNALASYEFAPAFRLYTEGKYVSTRAFSVGQPAFDFATFLAPDNAFLIDRFGAANAANGALVTRDHFDFGIRGEDIKRKTLRFVVGADGEISENARYDVSYVYGRTKTTGILTSNLINDRYYLALDAVRDPATGAIVCRSTLDPTAVAEPNGIVTEATTFTPGANSPCRPLNLLGNGVASPEALAFVLADNTNRSTIRQDVVSGYVSGDFGALFELPGGPIRFALGGEYRRERSEDTPDALVLNGSLRDFSQASAVVGKFSVKEAFAELDVPLLRDVPFAHLLSASAAIRLSDYSTIGNTTTWKVDGIYAPIADIRFRGTYSEAVRAPNIGELFQPSSGTFGFVTDPCDFRRINEGKDSRPANCAAILGGLGLSPAQIAAFSPSTDPENSTSRRGETTGNLLLSEESARTWTAGVVLRPRFLPGFAASFDWYNIRIKGAINTATPTQLAELCVDQPTIDNQFCANIFRAPGTGFVLGDGDDPLRQIGFRQQPQNVAAFRTSGADFSVSYSFRPSDSFGKFGISLVGGYLNTITFVPTIGADLDNDILETDNPRWRGSGEITWDKDGFTLGYTVNWFSKTRRFVTETLQGNPDISDPSFFFIKEKWEHDVRAEYDINDRFSIYGGVNNLADEKPDFADLSYPVSGIGRFFYTGVKVKLD